MPDKSGKETAKQEVACNTEEEGYETKAGQ